MAQLIKELEAELHVERNGVRRGDARRLRRRGAATKKLVAARGVGAEKKLS